jgi:hypothetical protein
MELEKCVAMSEGRTTFPERGRSARFVRDEVKEKYQQREEFHKYLPQSAFANPQFFWLLP